MAAFVFTASAASAVAGDAGAADAAAKTITLVTVDPTQAALVSLEASAYEAWKSKDAKFWNTFLSDNFVGWGSSGRLDKASATKQYTGADCEIKSHAISDVQLSPLGRDVALVTHKISVVGTCGGQKSPPASWAATVFRREGNQWKAAFHAEAAVIDPKAPPVKPVAAKAGSEQEQAKAAQDARTDALLSRETAIWDAWKDHDAKRLDGLTAMNLQFINIFGTHLATKAEALKNWSGEGCDVKAISLTDAAATMLSPTVGILTFRASADGTCFGQQVGPVWGSSIYVRDGDRWLWNFGINVPAPQDRG